MKFSIVYSIDKDINNYLNAGWKFIYDKYGRENIKNKLLMTFPEEFNNKIKNAKTKKTAFKIIDNYIKSFPKTFFWMNPIIETGVSTLINQKSEDIIKILEEIYKKPFPFKEITIYLTTFPIFPYNYKEKWFMSHRESSINGHYKTALHELNHFMFYFYFLKKLKQRGVSSKKIEMLKEALTVLSNPDEDDKPSIRHLKNYLKTHNKKPIDEIIELALISNLF